jgi:exonuclease VII large subunit
MAGVPGIVTQALGEERERQARERATLEQAAAGDILAAQQALAEAERRAREEEYNRWLKEQQQRLENLLKQAGLYETIYEAMAPERFTVGGRICN